MQLPRHIRKLIKKTIRIFYWFCAKRAEIESTKISRSNYKATWETHSKNESDAKIFVASQVDEEHLAHSAEYTVKILREKIKINNTDKILEIGCGVGRVGQLLAPLCYEWIGSDISCHMLSHAAKRLSQFNNVKFVELNDGSLKEIASNSMDIVYCTVVFMHLYEWDRYRYIEEAHRVLKTGGRCYFDNIDITSTHGWKVFEDSLSYPINERPPFLAMTSSADEFRTYGRRCGFRNFTVEQFDDAWVSLIAIK